MSQMYSLKTLFLVNRLIHLRQCRHISNEHRKSITETRTISQSEVDQFAQLTGDFNPIHSADHPIENRAVHGAFLNGLVAGIIGTKLPGPGSIAVSQSFSYPNRCVVGLPIEICVELVSQRKIIDIRYECVQQERLVFKGTARIIMQK